MGVTRSEPYGVYPIYGKTQVPAARSLRQMAVGFATGEGNRHGDPFPIFVPRCSPRHEGGVGPSRRGAQRQSRFQHRERRVGQVVQQLSWLADGSSCARPPSVCAPADSRPMTAAQVSVVDRVRRRVAQCGPPPSDLSSHEALDELLQCTDHYGVEAKHMASYEFEKVKILSKDFKVHDLCDVCPPEVSRVLADPERFIFRDPAQVDRANESDRPVRPYWDPKLREPQELRRLVDRLRELGLIGFRREVRGRIGIFFVKKKDGSQRLIIDAREANRLHKRPPHSWLGTVGALKRLDLSDSAISDACGGALPSDLSPCGASIDLWNGFYQFRNRALGSWFGLDVPRSAAYWGATCIYNEATRCEEPVGPEDVVVPCFEGMAMGWSWALWMCNSVLSHAGRIPGSLTLRDRSAALTPTDKEAVMSPYVDNGNVIGITKSSVDFTFNRVVEDLEGLGLICHERVDVQDSLQLVGIVFDGSSRTLRHTPRRTWRLHLGIQQFLKRQRASGHIVRVLVGHIVHAFELLRPCMCLLKSVYAFITKHLHECVEIWPSVRQELSAASWLLFLAEARLGDEFSDISYLSDSNDKGYALLTRELSSSSCRAAARFRERWRFCTVEGKESDRHQVPGTQASWLLEQSADASEFQKWIDHSCTPVSAGAPPRLGLPWRELEVKELTAVEAGIDPIDDATLNASDWHLVVAGGWSHAEATHLLEGRIMLGGLRRSSRVVRHHGRRLLSLGDNLSSILAFEKGRACDEGLRRLASKAAAIQVGCEIDWVLRYVETDRNAADPGSRLASAGKLKPGQTVVGKRGEALVGPLGSAAPANGALLRPTSIRPPPGLSLTQGEALGGPLCSAAPANGALLQQMSISPPPGLTLTHCSSPGEAGPPHSSSEPETPTPLAILPTARPPGLSLPSQPGKLRDVCVSRARPVRCLVERPPGATAPFKALRQRQSKKPAVGSGKCSERLGRKTAVLEVFSGCGRFTGACRMKKLRTGPALDILSGAHMDLSRRKVQLLVKRWVRTGRVWCVLLGTPCTTWSRARTTASSGKLRGMQLASFSAQLIRLCKQRGVHTVLENPKSSGLWAFPPVARALAYASSQPVHLDMCRYGALYMKPTTLHTTLPGAEVLGLRCRGGHWHEHLQGTVRVLEGGRMVSRWRTSLAGKYPPGLCHALASLLALSAPATAFDASGMECSSWEAELCQACRLPAVLTQPPICPRKAVPAWPADSEGWGGRWGWAHSRRAPSQ